MKAMKQFSFTIVAMGVDPLDERFEDKFFEAGCEDATISFQRGVLLFEFSRWAKNFAHALVSAIEDVRSAGGRVVHVEPDHLVNLSEIAERTGVSRSLISFFTTGQRGKGFPAPIARITTESPMWDWLEVVRWMYRTRRVDRHMIVEARIVREANKAIRRDKFDLGLFARRLADIEAGHGR
jgi:hypothetical protein